MTLSAVPGGGGSGQTVPGAEECKVRRWMPFSSGQRDCVGQSLARMNYITTVAMLLARFSLRLAEVWAFDASLRSEAEETILQHAAKHARKGPRAVTPAEMHAPAAWLGRHSCTSETRRVSAQ